MKIKWDESICLGVPQLDEDHKRLIRTLNFMEAHQDDDVRSESISVVIEQIREFASHHFHHEEEYMLKVGFPDYQTHKEQHRQFREKYAALCIDVMNHKETTPQDIYNYLSDWVTNHFLDFDKELRTFLETKKAHNGTA